MKKGYTKFLVLAIIFFGLAIGNEVVVLNLFQVSFEVHLLFVMVCSVAAGGFINSFIMDRYAEKEILEMKDKLISKNNELIKSREESATLARKMILATKLNVEYLDTITDLLDEMEKIVEYLPDGNAKRINEILDKHGYKSHEMCTELYSGTDKVATVNYSVNNDGLE